MQKSVKIGITGPMSEVNFGDYAMSINNIYDIGLKDITIFSYNKGFSEKIMDDYCESFNINTVEVILKQKREPSTHENFNISKVGFLPFNAPTETPLDILYKVENLEELKEAISNIDVLIVNGGGYFNHLWNNSLWRSDMLKKIISPMIIASQMKKEIIFTGNGFGPFDQSEEFFNYIFNYLDRTTYAIRDRMYSAGYLNKINIKQDKIKFIPDDLYIINNEIINMETRNMGEINSLGKYIVLETYFSLEQIKEYKENIKIFSEKMHEKYGLSIVFLPFDFQRGGMWQGEYLSKELSNFYLYDLNKVGYLPIQDAVEIIRNAELVICTRYHALVLSIGAGVPVVNTIKKVCDDHRYYFNKNYGLLEYAFEGLKFDEMNFMKIDFLETLEFLSENISETIKYQKELYASRQYKENKHNLTNIRNEHLRLISGSDK